MFQNNEMIKNQFKHNISFVKKSVIILLFLSFPLLYFVSSNLLFFAFNEINPEDSIGIIRKKIESNSSIAFFIAMNTTYEKSPDLRTRFWEKQLKDFTGNYKITYFSDTNKYINGRYITKYVENNERDPGYCTTFPKIFKDISKNMKDFQWFFFANMFTYINITNLEKHLEKLELRHDPLKDVVYAYSLVNYRGHRHPSVLSGFLASNYAIQQLAKTDGIHTQCMTDNINYAIGRVMRSLNVDIERWKSDLFISNWPVKQTEKKKKGKDPFPKCNGENVPISKTISMNMKMEHSKSIQLLKTLDERCSFEVINNKESICLATKFQK